MGWAAPPSTSISGVICPICPNRSGDKEVALDGPASLVTLGR